MFIKFIFTKEMQFIMIKLQNKCRFITRKKKKKKKKKERKKKETWAGGGGACL